MKFFILLLLFFVVFGFLFGFSVLRLFVRAIFGTRSRQTSASQTQSKQNAHTSQQESATPKQKKIFTPEEGDYVEYEEVKD